MKCGWNGRFHLGLLAASIGMGLWTVAISAPPARPQTPSEAAPHPSTVRTLHVNSNSGSDTSDGSPSAPLRTITAALRQATPGTIIQLVPGTYSAETGEVFPLSLASGVTLRGDESRYGEGYEIVGGGTFISPTMARQSITILPKDNSEIRGVSVRNEGRRGYAVWTESTAPTIEHNTFTGSVHDGVFLAGESNAYVVDNRFYRNGANGISVLGTSSPTIVDNLIQETGYGIAISQKSRPIVVNNRISRNRSGLVITGSSQPLLRNNVITENLEDGLVAISTALPDLGTDAEPGGNLFEGNGNYHIHNATKGNIIQAVGNQMNDPTKIQGDVAFTSTDAGAVDIATVPSLYDAFPAIDPSAAAPSAVTPTPSKVSDSSQPPPEGLTSIAPSPDSSGAGEAIEESEGGAEFRSVSPTPVSSTASSSPSAPPVPQSPTEPLSDPAVVESPSGQSPSLQPQSSSNSKLQSAASSSDIPQPIPITNDVVRAATYPTRYRVLIAPKTGDTIEAVRVVAPAAISAQSAGREVYLVGHYSTRSEAQAMLDRLTNKGYVATAEAIEGEVDS